MRLLMILLLFSFSSFAQNNVEGKWKITGLKGMTQTLIEDLFKAAAKTNTSSPDFKGTFLDSMTLNESSALGFFGFVYVDIENPMLRGYDSCELYLYFREDGKVASLAICNNEFQESHGEWLCKNNEVEFLGTDFFGEETTPYYFTAASKKINDSTLVLSKVIQKRPFSLTLTHVKEIPGENWETIEAVGADEWPVMEEPAAGEEPIFTFVEELPEFPGGDAAMLKFIQTNLRYPQMEKENDISGKVVVQFVIKKDGSVDFPEVTHSVSPGLDEEALRIVRLLPDFKPARQQGKAVNIYYNLPIRFSLE